MKNRRPPCRAVQLLLALFVTLVLAACRSLEEAPSLATLANPERELITYIDDFTLDCGDFNVLIQNEGSLKIIRFFDKQGKFVRDQFHWSETGTLTHETTGAVIHSSAHYTDALNGADGTLTFNGVPLKLKLPNGGVIVDAGRLVFDPETDEAFFLAGPHTLLGNVFTVICEALR